MTVPALSIYVCEMDDLDCPLRLQIHPHPFGTSSRGVSCRGHGGHCMPDEHCEARRKRAGHSGLLEDLRMNPGDEY